MTISRVVGGATSHCVHRDPKQAVARSPHTGLDGCRLPVFWLSLVHPPDRLPITELTDGGSRQGYLQIVPGSFCYSNLSYNTCVESPA
jgi:hypothetical protein